MKYLALKAHPQTTFTLTTDEPLWDLRCDPYLHAFGCDPFSSIYPVKKSSAYSIVSHYFQFVFQFLNLFSQQFIYTESLQLIYIQRFLHF